MTDGGSVSDYACYPDGCSPTDELDWYKILAVNGDVVELNITSGANNPTNNNYDAQIRITDDSGTNLTGPTVFHEGGGGSFQATVNGSQYIYFEIRSLDSGSHDGFDYSFTVNLLTQNRDTDADGFRDSDDDCASVNGTSDEDRSGCPDIDGDGWSNPDANWTYVPLDCTNNGTNCADAFQMRPNVYT